MNNRGELGQDAMEYIQTVKELEAEYKSVQTIMQNMKKSELDRINKEYLINDYERRFKVPHEVIISALMGKIILQMNMPDKKENKKNISKR